MKTLQDIALTKLAGVYVEDVNEGGETLTVEEVVTIVKNLGAYGYTLSKEAVGVMSKIERKSALGVYSNLMDTLDKYLGDKGYKPFYKGFPKEVINMDTEEMYFYACIHYLFGVVPDSKEDLLKLEVEESKLKELTPLNLVTKESVMELLVSMLSSNVTLSGTDVGNIKVIMDSLTDSEVQGCLDKSNMVIKELIITVGAHLLPRTGVTLTIFDTVTDVLRFIVKLSGYDLEDRTIIFRKFSRPELRGLLSILETIKNQLDDMNRNKELWRTFFKLNTGKINWKHYPRTKYSKDALFGEHKYTTVIGEIDELMSNYRTLVEYGRDFLGENVGFFVTLEKLLDKISTRPGHFARNLVSILTLVEKSGEDYVPYVIGRFKRVTSKINNRVLYQLLDRLINMGKEELPRIVKIKGRYVRIDETQKLSEETLTFVIEEVKNCIGMNLMEKGMLGRVYIDESFKNYPLTTSEKGSNEVLYPITLGTRKSFNKDVDVLRVFASWKNIVNAGVKEPPMYTIRVDIDLGTAFFDEDFNHVSTVAWNSLDSLRDCVAFSGDIVNAPNGAVEYIDIYDIDGLRKKGNRYILMSLYSYTGQTFSEIGVNAGLMELTKEEAEKHQNWYTTAITNGYNVTSDSVSTSTMIVDIEKCEIIWLDSDINSRGYANSFRNTGSIQGSILKWVIEKDWVTMYDVLELNAKARGCLVESKEDADVIFDEITFNNPLPLNKILSEYI